LVLGKNNLRAVDQDGEVVDVYLQERRDANAAKRFFQRFIKAGAAISRKPCRSLRPVQSTQAFFVSEVFQAISA
jgi:hypothetical protein